MGGCCRPGDLDDVFDARRAERKARDYERRGVGGDSRRIVDLVRDRMPSGYTVLEVGGGVGEIPLELLKDGAASAVNVELATTYEAAASALIDRHGLTGRVERRLGDFVAAAGEIAQADVVVMNRVVCCDARPEAMVGAAAARARRLLVITIPVERWWIRLGLGVANLFLAFRGVAFRGYVHPTRTVVAAAERQGLRLVRRDPAILFQLLAFERATDDLGGQTPLRLATTPR